MSVQQINTNIPIKTWETVSSSHIQ